MKLDTKTAFAAYIDYGSGRKRVGGFYPIASAAIAAFKKSGERNYYMTISKSTLLNIDGQYFEVKGEPISRKDQVKSEKFPELQIFSVTYRTERQNSWGYTNNYYFMDERETLEYIFASEEEVRLRGALVIKDEENFYILESSDPVTLEKVIVSRDLAIAEALSKLTKEEKDLLGL